MANGERKINHVQRFCWNKHWIHMLAFFVEIGHHCRAGVIKRNWHFSSDNVKRLSGSKLATLLDWSQRMATNWRWRIIKRPIFKVEKELSRGARHAGFAPPQTEMMALKARAYMLSQKWQISPELRISPESRLRLKSCPRPKKATFLFQAIISACSKQQVYIYIYMCVVTW